MVELIDINEGLVLLNLEAHTNLEAIDIMAQHLYQQDIVFESYINAIKNRELEFSTGLPGTDFPIAIPHADPQHVKRDAICIGICQRPVPFIMMGSENTQLDCEIIFMLAIKNGHAQIELLQALIELFQKPTALQSLKQASSKQGVVTLFKELLYGKERKE